MNLTFIKLQTAPKRCEFVLIHPLKAEQASDGLIQCGFTFRSVIDDEGTLGLEANFDPPKL